MAIKPPKDNSPEFLRRNPVSFNLNDHEMMALEKYFKKYKIKNRSQFIRETVMTAVLRKFDQDYPVLFDDES